MWNSARKTLPLLLIATLTLACTSTKPAKPAANVQDPHTDPTIVNGIYEGGQRAMERAEAGASAGRKVGTVVGLLAAVLGGSGSESLDDALDRFHRTRDTIEIAGAVIGMTRGAAEDSKQSSEIDTELAALRRIDGAVVARPADGELLVTFEREPTTQQLEAVAAVFAGREDRVIEIEAPSENALAIRDALIDAGLSASCLNAHRGASDGVVLRIRRRS